jgi:hypothetical protein
MASVILSVLIPVITKLGQIYAAVFNAIPVAIEGIIKFIEKTVNSVIDFVNKIIRQINKLSGILGYTIGELERVSIEADFGRIDTPKVNTDTSDINIPSASEAITSTPIPSTPSYVTTNDYSNKDITINVTVENYAEQVDVDDMVRQINMKLAEAL